MKNLPEDSLKSRNPAGWDETKWNPSLRPLDPANGYPAGEAIRYECLACGDTLKSIPPHAAACKCRNVIVDVDAGRITVKDAAKFKVYLS